MTVRDQLSDCSERGAKLSLLAAMYQDVSVHGDVPHKQITSELEVRLTGPGRSAVIIVTVDTRLREVHNKGK
jgi:hypothetical protein